MDPDAERGSNLRGRLPRATRLLTSRPPSARLACRATLEALVLVAALPAGVAAQTPEATVVVREVRVERNGVPVSDSAVVSLIEVQPDQPLDPILVRESIFHLVNLGRFDDVTAQLEESAGGAAVVFEVTPLRRVSEIEFVGDLGVSKGLLEQTVRERFGTAPPVGRAPAMVQTLELVLRDYGHLNARVDIAQVPGAREEEAVLRITVAAGPRAHIGHIEVTGSPHVPPDVLLGRLQLHSGAPFERPALSRRIAREVNELHAKGRYLAAIDAVPSSQPDGTVDLQIAVEPGPVVSVRIEGDELTRQERETFLPVEREGSVDEDLLEDAQRNLERHLKEQGHRESVVSYRREPGPDTLGIVFAVTKGPLFHVGPITLEGNAALSDAELLDTFAVKPEEVYVDSRIERGVDAIRRLYRTRGFTSAAVSLSSRSKPPGEGGAAVALTLAIVEGPRTLLTRIEFEGASALSEGTLLGAAGLAEGTSYVAQQIEAAREALLAAYDQRGFREAQVEVRIATPPGTEEAHVTFRISEGRQLRVGRVLVSGNRRIGVETILRELTVKEGEPLSSSVLVDSQRRVVALGLFRRVEVLEIAQAGTASRDVVVKVEESPPTTIGYGGGAEVGTRLVTEADGSVSEQIEGAWRAFFEIGRRNLFGKNRSVNLFTRVSLRRKNPNLEPGGDAQRSLGFNEYRVLGTYREPRVFNWNANGQLAGFSEQAIRPSFSFQRNGVQAELVRPAWERFSLIARYAYDHTRLFDEQLDPADIPIIDRLFPRVTLSTLSLGLLRDTRDDPLDATSGTLIGFDQTLAARALGSEVGFVKSFVRGFVYRRVPGSERVVFAGGLSLGLARAFVTGIVNDTSDLVRDLPASERFFAGGATTVRGFALDRLGNADTLDADGVPKGGNALLVMNAELRVRMWRSLGAAFFFDAGNVFRRVTDFDLTDVRGTPGLGFRYKSPLGPIRVDVGLKLDRQQFANGKREPLTAFHISIGQAF